MNERGSFSGVVTVKELCVCVCMCMCKYVCVRGIEAVNVLCLTHYQPMTHICVMSSHKFIRIYMGV